MWRKGTILVVIVMLLAAALLPGSAAAQGGNVTIMIPLMEPEYTITTSDTLWFFTGWGVCRARGLIEAYENAYAVSMSMNGQVLVDGTVHNTKPYWWPIEEGSVFGQVCNNHPSKTYEAFWVYWVGSLPPGDYVFAITETLAHQVTDLNDMILILPNGDVVLGPDGHPDKYPASASSYQTVVHVVPG